jgi:hypothetical protein
LIELYPGLFPSPHPEDRDKFSNDNLIRIFQERRKALVESVQTEAIADWVKSNPIQAYNAELQIRAATLENVSEADRKLFQSEKPSAISRYTGYSAIATPTTTTTKTAFQSHAEKIIAEIEAVQESYLTGKEGAELKKESDKAQQRLETAQQIANSDPQANILVQEMHKNLRSRQREMEQKLTDHIARFIESKIPCWEKEMALPPSSHLFDIGALSRIFCFEKNIPNSYNSRAETVMTEEENAKRNEEITEKKECFMQAFTESLAVMKQIGQDKPNISKRSFGLARQYQEAQDEIYKRYLLETFGISEPSEGSLQELGRTEAAKLREAFAQKLYPSATRSIEH